MMTLKKMITVLLTAALLFSAGVYFSNFFSDNDTYHTLQHVWSHPGENVISDAKHKVVVPPATQAGLRFQKEDTVEDEGAITETKEADGDTSIQVEVSSVELSKWMNGANVEAYSKILNDGPRMQGSLYKPDFNLPVFDSLRQLSKYPEWYNYLMGVYGNNLTFPLSLRDFTFFWERPTTPLPTSVQTYINNHRTVEQRGKASALMSVPTGVIFMTQSILVSFLIKTYGWRNSYSITALILTPCLLIGLVFLRDSPESMTTPSTRNARMGDFISLSAWNPNLRSPKLMHVYGDRDVKKQVAPGPFMRLHPAGFPSYSKVEVYHQCCDGEGWGFWNFLAPGSGIFLDLGKTIVFFTHFDGCAYFEIKRAIRKHLSSPDFNMSSPDFKWWTMADNMMRDYRKKALNNTDFTAPLIQMNAPCIAHLSGDPVLFPPSSKSYTRAGTDCRIIDKEHMNSEYCSKLVKEEAPQMGYDTVQYMNHWIGGGTSQYEVVDLRTKKETGTCPDNMNSYSSGWGGKQKCSCHRNDLKNVQFVCDQQFYVQKKTKNYRLKIIFTGDVHGYIDNSINLARMIDHARVSSSSERIILLDAGDVFVGSKLFSMFGPHAIAEEMRLLKYDAMALGNHDFEFKNSLRTFVSVAQMPVVSANVPNVIGVVESTIVNKGEFRIGITAYSVLDIAHHGYISQS